MPRQKQEEIPMEGPGVSVPRYKDLDRLADQFIEVRDEKAKLATKLGQIEEKIIEKMKEHELGTYTYSDQLVEFKRGADHIKVKTVKATDGAGAEEDLVPD